jgi:hypothetical protein
LTCIQWWIVARAIDTDFDTDTDTDTDFDFDFDFDRPFSAIVDLSDRWAEACSDRPGGWNILFSCGLAR